MLFKSRWSSFKTRFSPEPFANSKRRKSECSCCTHHTLNLPDQRKRKLTASIIEIKAERLFNSIPNPFRRRESSNHSNYACDIQKEQGIKDLYNHALDEISYAKDSLGTPYYAGDLESTREAIQAYSRALHQLLQQTQDSQRRVHIESTLGPCLYLLKQRYDSLPPPMDSCQNSTYSLDY
ncbi:hypothetical protein BDF14DRAFT_1764250 [Spinellus fusiger]|nr:hypothetical protein BDF14DRAFT_1764250 [Spinellus fusiger]